MRRMHGNPFSTISYALLFNYSTQIDTSQELKSIGPKNIINRRISLHIQTDTL